MIRPNTYELNIAWIDTSKVATVYRQIGVLSFPGVGPSGETVTAEDAKARVKPIIDALLDKDPHYHFDMLLWLAEGYEIKLPHRTGPHLTEQELARLQDGFTRAAFSRGPDGTKGIRVKHEKHGWGVAGSWFRDGDCNGAVMVPVQFDGGPTFSVAPSDLFFDHGH